MDATTSTDFVRQLTESQRLIYAYLRTLVRDRAAVDDLLQETNVALWQQAERFEPGTNFHAWACKVAYFKVLSYRKTCQRSKLQLDDALINQIAQSMETMTDDRESRQKALLQCLDALPQRQRELLRLRYEENLDAAGMAKRLERSAGAIAQWLFRLRAKLLNCVQQRLSPAEIS